ncbi:unnamed protein product [Penicillium salamii]|nr:unnamed protein product [Penicillium salamii]
MFIIDYILREFIDCFLYEISVYGILAVFLIYGDAKLFECWAIWCNTWFS